MYLSMNINLLGFVYSIEWKMIRSIPKDGIEVYRKAQTRRQILQIYIENEEEYK